MKVIDPIRSRIAKALRARADAIDPDPWKYSCPGIVESIGQKVYPKPEPTIDVRIKASNGRHYAGQLSEVVTTWVDAPVNIQPPVPFYELWKTS